MLTSDEQFYDDERQWSLLASLREEREAAQEEQQRADHEQQQQEIIEALRYAFDAGMPARMIDVLCHATGVTRKMAGL